MTWAEIAVHRPRHHNCPMRDVLTLTLNGEQRAFEAPEGGQLSVLGLLTELGLDMRKVAVERNEEIVPRSRYIETWLANGDQLEIVHFIGGG
jgi:thiazole synthase/sulfur carrier protein